MIDWQAFDWQSFTTLVASAFAVIGAVIVGLKQTAVLRKQTEIAELTLRNDLFEKRYAVFASTRDFLTGILQSGDRAEPVAEQSFLRGVGESHFLFRASVPQDLMEIWKRYSGFAVLKAEMDSLYRREGHYGDGNPHKSMEMLSAFNADLTDLHRLFGDELRLGRK